MNNFYLSGLVRSHVYVIRALNPIISSKEFDRYTNTYNFFKFKIVFYYLITYWHAKILARFAIHLSHEL